MALEMCDDDHDAIAFEGRACPMCELKKQYAQLEKTFKEQEAELNEANDVLSDYEDNQIIISQLEARIAELEAKPIAFKRQIFTPLKDEGGTNV